MIKEYLSTIRPKLNKMTGRWLCHEQKPSEMVHWVFILALTGCIL